MIQPGHVLSERDHRKLAYSKILLTVSRNREVKRINSRVRALQMKGRKFSTYVSVLLSSKLNNSLSKGIIQWLFISTLKNEKGKANAVRI